MASIQRSIEATTVTGVAINTAQQQIEQPYSERWRTVLDDPTFRRLLRDGHCADATAYLLTQLGDEE
jgi:hypothetical protein